jgi:hypothetical protein
MAPTLRNSSAQNSPTSAGRTSTNHSPTTTPRKTHQCSKCKRPRAGHPRSGCPFVDSPSSETKTQDKAENHLTDKLGSMSLLSPAPIETKEDKAFIRNRRRSAQPELIPSDSLLSLSTNSSEIVARLLRPGMFDDTDEDDRADKGKVSKVVRWQDTIAASSASSNTPSKFKTPGRSPMPGSLFPPTPESSFASALASDVEEISAVFQQSNIAFANPSVTSTSTIEPLPLARSMSATERDIFMSKLNIEAKATLCVFDKADIAAMYAKAVNLHKFVVQVMMNDDKNDSQALLIVGQDEEAVNALLRHVEGEIRREKATLKEVHNHLESRSSKLGMAAGGVVVGAVGAWAGLAFS